LTCRKASLKKSSSTACWPTLRSSSTSRESRTGSGPPTPYFRAWRLGGGTKAAAEPTTRPSAGARAAAAHRRRLVLIVQPRVQQLRPHPQLVTHRANLRPRQKPANSPTEIPRQRSAARIIAAYTSFRTGRSPNACGMIFVRRRSSRKRRSRRLVVRITLRWRNGKRRCAMQASKSSVKHWTTAGSSRPRPARSPPGAASRPEAPSDKTQRLSYAKCSLGSGNSGPARRPLWRAVSR
jgi:hypothetical protein